MIRGGLRTFPLWLPLHTCSSFQITVLGLKDAYLLKPPLPAPSFVLRVIIALAFTPQDPNIEESGSLSSSAGFVLCFEEVFSLASESLFFHKFSSVSVL